MTQGDDMPESTLVYFSSILFKVVALQFTMHSSSNLTGFILILYSHIVINSHDSCCCTV